MSKTKDEFKDAFKAIKKPKLPKNVPSKMKAGLDKTILQTTDFNDPEILKLAEALYATDPDYTIDLIAYKIAKHFDEDSDKRPSWVQQMPKEAVAKALAKVVPNDASNRLTQVTLERSISGKGNQSNTAAIIFQRDPEGTADFALAKWKEAKDGDDKTGEAAWLGIMVPGRDTAGGKLKAVAKSGDVEAASLFGSELSFLVDGAHPQIAVDHAAVLAVARENPKLFITKMLPSLKQKNEFVEITADPDLQNFLAGAAGDEWNAFVAETPSLSLLSHVSGALQKGKVKTDAGRVDVMFDSIVNNRGISIGYAASTVDNNRVILTGGTPADKDFREKQVAGEKEINEERGITDSSFPDIPSTQCHMLLHLTSEMVNLCPGLTKKPVITQGTVKNICMTVPLGSIKGTGVLDKSFGGNVFDETGSPTDQILFTGDNGASSHTWLIIDGMPFDPVLGTKGDDVAKAVAETFDWNISDRVAEGSKGNFIIKGDPKTPKPKGNKMGFSGGYTITRTPEKYLTPEELKKSAAGKKAREEEAAAEERRAEAKLRAKIIA